MRLMNNILNKYLVLVYSINEEEHKENLKLELQNLRENQLYSKFKKCEFYKIIIQYMCHVISKEELVFDLEKVKAMVNWHIPKYVSIVR